MTRRNTRRSGAILAADLMLVPMVAAMRLPLMLTESRGSGLAGKETLHAVTEKTAAFAEGVMAANLSVVTSMMSFWPDIIAGRTPSLLSGAAVEHSVHAALKPSGRRVRANYKRLSGRKA
jgi:hypothetical protein